MKIHKYKISLMDSQLINIPSPQRFLSFQSQNGDLCVWYEVREKAKDVNTDFETIEFIIRGTGDSAPEDAQYLGTVQQLNFVWHLYARVKP